MPKKIGVITLPMVILILLAMLSPSFALDKVPQESACSERYTRSYVYPLPKNDLTKNWKKAMAPWDISKGWGVKERIDIVNEPKTQQPSLKVSYPQGSINPGNDDAPRGGAGFYARGGFGSGVNAACLRYRVFFPEGFEFVKGGKLPGLYGGESASGCREGAGITGFSTRYMWRKQGNGTLYTYLPDRHAHCGELVGLGSWVFTTGRWFTLEQEVVLNDIGKENGLIRVWVDGKKVIDLPGTVIRTTANITIEGMMFSTFFGGKDPSWASPKDQFAYFSDFTAFFPK